jgi:hypothetical protein
MYSSALVIIKYISPVIEAQTPLLQAQAADDLQNWLPLTESI